MQVQIDIEFDQLVQVAKSLSSRKWQRLKKQVEQKMSVTNSTDELKKFLSSAPTFSKKELAEIKTARQSINRWRAK